MRFENRQQAGELLSAKLQKFEKLDCMVFALPRGGVPVAKEVADRLKVPVSILAVRKIAAPMSEELAVGAICENDKPMFNDKLMRRLVLEEDDLIHTIYAEKMRIKEIIEKFRGGEEIPPVAGKIAIIVDDGMATGATLWSAVSFLKKHNAHKIVVAVPVASLSSAQNIRKVADEVVSLHENENFASVSDWYDDFTEVTDDDVLSILTSAKYKVPTPKKKISHEDDLEELLLKEFKEIRKPQDLDPLIDSIKDKRVVMLGEASHGTEEYYQLRRVITQRLIRDYGFKFVAVEGDWPDAFRVNQFIRHDIGGDSARDILLQNKRWPTWMWANEETVKLVDWMKDRNVGFYGLDVYSLFDSIDRVMEYVRKKHPHMIELVERHYSCFEPFEADEISYARSLLKYPEGCEKEVISTLRNLLHMRVSNNEDIEELFDAQQNGHVIANAEAYYRAMMKSDEGSWNIRDGHMMETLDRLLDRHGEGAKAIVWAHNTHIGDYRATDMKEHGYVNIGGLARKLYGEDNVALVGFGSYQGEVLASYSWGAPEQVMPLPPAREGSYESLFHKIAQKGQTNYFYLDMHGPLEKQLSTVRNHRAVGVVYNAKQEYRSNYVPTELSKRYDYFLFIDRTHALRSLHVAPTPGQFPETWPTGQ